MRIAIDGREFYEGRITGIGRYLANFIRAASAQRPAWEFLIFGSQHTKVPFEFGRNVRFEVMREINTQLWEQVQLPVRLKREACDLFYSPYPKTCLFSPVPSVMVIHDLTGLIYPGYAKAISPERFLTGLYAARASAILTPSENSKKDMVKLLGLDAAKISVCSGGVDPGIFFPRTGGAPAGRGVNGPYALYVGNSRPHKNVPGLVKAWGLLDRAQRNGHSLVLAGVGGYEVPPELGDSVKVLRALPEADLPGLYSAAGLFIFPSFYEGFGLPAVEAMACGCPVLSSDSSCMPEILGDAAAYFDPADPVKMAAAIAALLKDPEARAVLSKRGLERAGRYAPEATHERAVEVIESLAAGGGPAPGSI